MTDPHPGMSDQELFWGSDQYDFSVVLRAAGMECFWHFAHRGERFYLNFMVRRNTLRPRHVSLNKTTCCGFNLQHFFVKADEHHNMFYLTLKEKFKNRIT